MGAVANVLPCTNPTSTPSFLELNLLKTRNAMILSPHPATRKVPIGRSNSGTDASSSVTGPTPKKAPRSREAILSLIRSANYGLNDWRMATDGRYKLIIRPNEDQILFDLELDP